MPALSAIEAEIVSGLDSSLQPFALEHRRRALAAGLPYRFISGLRSREHQAALGTDPNRATPAAAAGKSKHEVGFAWDVDWLDDAGRRIYTDAQARALGELAEGLGLKWGGRFVSVPAPGAAAVPTPDPNHFEAPEPRDALATYRRLKLTLGAGLLALSAAWVAVEAR